MLPPSNFHRETLGLLEKTSFDQGMALERQIAVHVRQLIRSGVLVPGMRIPPIRALAQTWGTNYFTVQSALRTLVREGLLVQSPRLGTFVAEQTRSLQRVCLYHGEDLNFKGGSEFGARLHLHVYRMLAARGIQTVSYFDHRPGEERDQVPSEIRSLIKDRRVDAVISTTYHRAWLDRLDVPAVSMELPAARGGVDWDVAEFARLAVGAVFDAGRRSLCVLRQLSVVRQALPEAGEREIGALVEKEAVLRGIKVVSAPELGPGASPRSLEETGYMLGERLAGMRSRPEAVIVFPDTYTRGLVSALLKHNVQVPDEIMLVSHRNHEMPFFTPFPVRWITVKIEDMAEALLDQVEQIVSGKVPGHVDVPVELEPPVSPAKPRRVKKVS